MQQEGITVKAINITKSLQSLPYNAVGGKPGVWSRVSRSGLPLATSHFAPPMKFSESKKRTILFLANVVDEKREA